MRIPLSFAVGALGLVLSSCDGSSRATDARASVTADTAADVRAVKAIAAGFVEGWEKKDPAVKELYAPDAIMVTPNAVPQKGTASIGEAFEQFAANPNVALDLRNATTVVSAGGDMAFSQGVYASSLTDPKTKAIQRNQGYYVLIYKKQSDGSWKVIQDVSSPLPNGPEPLAAL